MTTAGEITAEDKTWASEFIVQNFMSYYFSVLNDNFPRNTPDWHRLFHEAWSADDSPKGVYDKALWIRREYALKKELKAAYARFLDRNVEQDEEVLEKIFDEYGLKEKIIQHVWGKP